MRTKINFAVFLYGQVFERWCFNHLIRVIYLFFEVFSEKGANSVSFFNVSAETLEHIRNVLIVGISKAVKAIANTIHTGYVFVVIGQCKEERNGAGTLNQRTYAIRVLLCRDAFTAFPTRDFYICRHAVMKIVVTL